MKVTLEMELEDNEQVMMLVHLIHKRFTSQVRVLTERNYNNE